MAEKSSIGDKAGCFKNLYKNTGGGGGKTAGVLSVH